MNVYKNYSDLIKRKISFVLFYGVILTMLIAVLANLTKTGSFSRVEQQKVRIAIESKDEGEAAKQLMHYLAGYCDIVTVDDKWSDRLDALYYRDVYYILTIPENYSEHVWDGTVQLECDSVEHTREMNYVNQLIVNYTRELMRLHTLYPQESLQEICRLASEKQRSTVEVIQKKASLLKAEAVHNNSFYNLLGFVLFACITTVICSSMYAYRRNTIYRRHLISPVPEAVMNLQLLLGNLAYSYLYTIVFLALIAVQGEKQILNINYILYWVNAFVYTTSVVCFAFWVSMRMRNKVIMYLVGNFGAMILSFISGVFIRQDYLSKQVVKISTMTPVYWFVHGNELIMQMSELDQTNLLELVQVVGIQLLFAGAFLCFVLVGMKLDAARK